MKIMYLNHIPNTTPCISRKHSCHNLNKSVHFMFGHGKLFQKPHNAGEKAIINIKVEFSMVHTLHMVVNVDQYTNQASPQCPCRKGQRNNTWSSHKWGHHSSVEHCEAMINWKYFHEKNLRHFRASATYLWTSLLPLRFVICHVNPLFGSKPGCEISKPCFLTSFMYLQ